MYDGKMPSGSGIGGYGAVLGDTTMGMGISGARAGPSTTGFTSSMAANFLAQSKCSLLHINRIVFFVVIVVKLNKPKLVIFPYVFIILFEILFL